MTPGAAAGSAAGGESEPAQRDEMSENIAQALKAAEAMTAAGAARAAEAAPAAPPSGAASSGGSGSAPGGSDADAAVVDAGAVGGDWSRANNRIRSQRHREAGTRAPKRYRQQVDDYFRRVARESEEEAKSKSETKSGADPEGIGETE